MEINKQVREHTFSALKNLRFSWLQWLLKILHIEML
jgi:hypothetical protein